MMLLLLLLTCVGLVLVRSGCTNRTRMSGTLPAGMPSFPTQASASEAAGVTMRRRVPLLLAAPHTTHALQVASLPVWTKGASGCLK